MPDASRRTISVDDPRALRGLAHPLRLALLALLRARGPLTATQAAPLVSESVASCSFHLRQLAKYGLVEPAAEGSGRARPWRATAEFTTWPITASHPELAQASDRLSAVVASRYAREITEGLARMRDEPETWSRAALIGDTLLYLSADELAELRTGVLELATRHRDRTTNPALRPSGARLVHFIHFAMPAE
jgi:DNA-binding transcriptional ArsR family regulator